ncbi:hypothetical protein PQR52_01610 [Paraburkholderia aspalathi]|uniref:hypothetical protein n=1 Tax=Paraburkholderia aspalathi TaxID=1324617 RepID=UPI0038BB71FD
MRTELYSCRDRSYGAWHRAPSIARFIDRTQAESLTMADLDSVLFTEYDHLGKVPLALVEVARDIGQDKPAGVLMRLAQLANVPAYVALYTPTASANPSNGNWTDIECFRVQRLWPQPEDGWRRLTPSQWAHALVRIRDWQMRRFAVREAANDPRY